MTQKPFFSVIVPVYQTASFLPDCLNSLLKQTESDFELIVVNDASPDNAAAVLKKYQHKYPTMRVITFRQNQGVSAARNHGLKHARGQYVYFLDSDDFIAPSLLKTVRQRLKKNNLDCLICAAHPTDKTGQKQTRSSLWHLDLIPDRLARQSVLTADDILPYPACIPVNPSFIFYKRSFLIKHHLTFPNIRFEDLVFQTAVFFAGARFSFLKTALVYYRQHEHSLFQAGDERFFDVFDSCAKRADIIAATQNPKARLYFLNSKYILLRNLNACIQKRLKKQFLKQTRRSLLSDNLTKAEQKALCPPAALFYHQTIMSLWEKILFFPIRLILFLLALPFMVFVLSKQFKKQK